MAVVATAMPGIAMPTNGDPVQWEGGKGSFFCQATWGGGSVTLQYMGPDGSTWEAVGTDTTLTADGGGNFELPQCHLRISVVTATGVTAKASPLPK